MNEIRKMTKVKQDIAKKMVGDLNNEFRDIMFFYKVTSKEICLYTQEMIFSTWEIHRIEKILANYNYYLDYFRIAEYSPNKFYFEFIALSE